MPIKAGLFVFIVSALVVRSSTPIKRSCTPSGYRHFEPFLTFTEAEDTGLLCLYVLYSPKKSRKLERCEKLWCKRSLILTLLILNEIETNPGEFACVLFLSTNRLKCTKVSERLLVNFEHNAVRKSIPEIRIEKHHNVILSVIFLDKFGIEILRKDMFFDLDLCSFIFFLRQQ